MVEFQLAKAHSEFRRIIPETYARLTKQYPFVTLTRVELIDPISSTDTSMGSALPGGIIQLNAYWFSGEPARLDAAAKRNTEVMPGVFWHGLMVQEPAQVLSHEFGHLIEEVAPELVQTWSKLRWKAATSNPTQAPSGYALVNSAEYFAEAFALFDLGFSGEIETADMKGLLNGVG